jgi:transketolase
MSCGLRSPEGAALTAGDISDEQVKELKAIAKELRGDVVRMIGLAGSGHPGGSLSCMEIVVSLYFYKMRLDPDDPDWPGRDRFVLSKGHAAPTLYATLSRLGYIERDQLWSLRRLGCPLQGHPDIRTPGVDICSGSLGQGLATACGMGLAARLDRADYKVYALLGDGEVQEGEVWESAMFAAHHRIDNLVALIDHNRLQIDGWCCDVMNLEPLADKWRAFGWTVEEIDGHDVRAICQALDRADEAPGPHMIVAHTVKGKGVSFMENAVEYHGKAPTPEQMEAALKEIEQS